MPGSGTADLPIYYVPPPTLRPEHDGLWLRILPFVGKPWIGVFAFGAGSALSDCRLVSSPNPGRLCIVSNGAGYIVEAGNPTKWEELPIQPVLDVRALGQLRLLIFSDFTRLAAYGPNGIVWRSPCVCWDELRIERISTETIEGTGANPLGPERLPFIVQLKTGKTLLEAPRANDGREVW